MRIHGFSLLALGLVVAAAWSPVAFVADQSDGGGTSSGSTDGSTSGDGGPSSSCTTDSPCPGGDVCAFSPTAGCGQPGTCVPAPTVVCQAYSPGCACDGTEINIACTGLPNGGVSKPLAHAGSCAADASTFDGAPGTCQTSGDCPSNEVCGFLATAGCGQPGTCVPAPNGGAACNSFLPGCACDGTEINIACTPLPSGYFSKPLAHSGVCGADASVSDGGPATCQSSADCPSNEVCGFLETNGCSAAGTCVSLGAQCALAPYVFGCGCDGTNVSIGCDTGLPSGYATKPLAHTGACTDSGAFAACTADCVVGKMCCPGGTPGSYACVALVDGGCPPLP